jgi:hypothetical protein
MVKILERDPPWETLPATTPPRVVELLHRCLEKDRNQRLRDAGDARLELERAERERGSATAVTAVRPVAHRRSRGLAIAAALAIVLAAAAASGAWWLARGPLRPPVPLRRLSVVFPPEQWVDAWLVAPTGELIVAARPRDGGTVAAERLYRRRLDGFDLAPIAGTEGVSPFGYTCPNPRQLAFARSRPGSETDVDEVRLPLEGAGTPSTIGQWDPEWSTAMDLPDGRELVTIDRSAEFVILPRGSRTPQARRRVDAGYTAEYQLVRFQPEPSERIWMHSFRFTDRGFTEGTVAVDLETGKAQTILDEGVAYGLVDDILLYSRGEDLLAARFDRRRRRLVGPEVSLVTGLRLLGNSVVAMFALTSDGTLVYEPGGRVASDRQLVACVPSGDGGRCTPWSPARRFVTYFAFGSVAPSGNAVAAQTMNARGTLEIWRFAPDGSIDPLVAIPGADVGWPTWSKDGRRLAFFREALGTSGAEQGIWVTGLDGTPPRQVAGGADGMRRWPIAWMGDGHTLIAGRRPERSAQGGDVVRIDLDTGASSDLLETPFDERPLGISPDGQRLVFSSDRSGSYEAYIAELGVDGTLGQQHRLSRGRVGRWPVAFTPDGHGVYFYDDAKHVRLARLDAHGVPIAEAPAVVLDLDREKLLETIAALPDGRLLAIHQGRGEGGIDRLEVVLGFADEVRRRMKGAS